MLVHPTINISKVDQYSSKNRLVDDPRDTILIGLKIKIYTCTMYRYNHIVI